MPTTAARPTSYLVTRTAVRALVYTALGSAPIAALLLAAVWAGPGNLTP